MPEFARPEVADELQRKTQEDQERMENAPWLPERSKVPSCESIT